MNEYVQITFNNIQSDQQEQLIALLAEAGYEGFEQEENILKAFIPKSRYDLTELSEITMHYMVSFTIEDIPEQNWNEAWESNFQPVIIEDLVGIRAHFHQPIKNAKHEIVITPKMSFGTGHHATTEMMIREMGRIDFTGKRVFDFGTGTGVLAILAGKMGAIDIIAVDNDEWSIRNASENFSANDVSGIRVQLLDKPAIPGEYDIILANINKHVIIDHFGSLVELLSQNGTLLLSGILYADKEEIISHAVENKLRLISEATRGEWICLRFSR